MQPSSCCKYFHLIAKLQLSDLIISTTSPIIVKISFFSDNNNF